MAKPQQTKRPREADVGSSSAKRAKTGKGKNTGKDGKPMYKSKTSNGSGGKGKADEKPVAKTKEELKELHKHRKSQRSHADIMEQLKKLWEVLRVKEMEEAKRKATVEKMGLALKDNAVLIIHKHDGARIIECYIKYAGTKERIAIIEELIKDLLPLVKSKYGKFVVFKILKYSTNAQKQVVMKAVKGQVLHLVKHKEGAHFLDTLFSDYCNEKARAALIQEFFGPEYALLGDAEGKTLKEIFKTLDAERKKDLLKDMASALAPVLNKDSVVFSIVHRALLEFMLNANPEAVSDMIINIRELVPEILHTKDGSNVSVICVQRGTNKDRKLIVKALKPVADKVCMEEYGFLVMCAIFDNIDDTVLVGKSLLQAVAGKIEDIVANKFGWKTIMYLLQDRANKSVMNPSLQKVLSEGDGNPYSKKDRKVRRTELRAFVSSALSAACEANMASWVIDFFSCLLTGEILLHAGVSRSHMEALATLVQEDPELLANLDTHRLLKRLVKEDTPEDTSTTPFAVLLANKLGGIPAISVDNQGTAFVLVALLESTYEAAKTATKSVLKAVKALKTLEKLNEKQHNAGTRILLKLLKEAK